MPGVQNVLGFLQTKVKTFTNEFDGFDVSSLLRRIQGLVAYIAILLRSKRMIDKFVNHQFTIGRRRPNNSKNSQKFVLLWFRQRLNKFSEVHDHPLSGQCLDRHPWSGNNPHPPNNIALDPDGNLPPTKPTMAKQNNCLPILRKSIILNLGNHYPLTLGCPRFRCHVLFSLSNRRPINGRKLFQLSGWNYKSSRLKTIPIIFGPAIHLYVLLLYLLNQTHLHGSVNTGASNTSSFVPDRCLRPITVWSTTPASQSEVQKIVQKNKSSLGLFVHVLFSFLVAPSRLELEHHCWRGILNPLCLPFHQEALFHTSIDSIARFLPGLDQGIGIKQYSYPLASQQRMHSLDISYYSLPKIYLDFEAQTNAWTPLIKITMPTDRKPLPL